MDDLKIPKEFSSENEQTSKKNKKTWQPKKTGLTNRQKLALCLTIILVPFTLYIVLPLLARKHFCNYLKLPQEVFLSEPKLINLVKTGEIGATYSINVNGYDFEIPEKYTPAAITENSVDLTNSSRLDARLIHIYTDINDKNFNFSNFGISKWFMPSNPATYMNIILHATWHPIRLLYKSQFYANEGLNTQVYETFFPNDHKGYIYATPGKNGYTSRIYNTYGPGFIEFAIKDTVKPPTLRDWVNMAAKIKTIKSISDIPNKDSKSEYELNELIALSQKGINESNILGICLSEYFRTKSPEWIIPIAYIMKNKEYYIDLNDLYKQFASKFPDNSPQKARWNAIMEEAVSNIIKIEIDPTNMVRELNIYCRNLTQLEIEDVVVEITVTNHLGQKRNFSSSLVEEAGKILPMLEKSIHVRVPENINLSNAQKIQCKITKIDFLR